MESGLERHNHSRGTGRSAHHWRIDDIPFHVLEPSRSRADPYLFYLLASASFVEITSDLYTQNLCRHFGDDAEMHDWLTRVWEPEEIQHGVALKRYVNRVWPELDWDEAYRRFHAEYAPLCRVERLAPNRALELVARCVVETGTASLYTMIQASTVEPVLRILAGRIRDDEVRHYRYFLRAFRRYREREPAGHYRLVRTLLHRIREIGDEDARIAFKHVYLARHPGGSVARAYQSFEAHWMGVARRCYPYSMAIKMLLKPIGLNPRLQHASVFVLLTGAKFFWP